MIRHTENSWHARCGAIYVMLNLITNKEDTMDPVVHFEMPFDDAKRAQKFYGSVFGWKAQEAGPEMGNYLVMTTTESTESGPVRPGAINGGLYPRMKDRPDDGPSFVIAVDDIKEAVKRIKAGGGTVLGEPVDIPQIGPYVSFVDTEGNRLSVLQPIPRGGEKK
jgi:uncharacterized protein